MAAPAWKLGAALVDLAGRRHGAVTREELLTLGFTRHMLEHLIAAGTLLPIHPGIYLVAPALAPLRHEAAAVLACRPRAMLSRLTACRLLGIPAPKDEEIEVMVVDRWRRSLQGVRVRSVSHLAPKELRRHQGLPIALLH